MFRTTDKNIDISLYIDERNKELFDLLSSKDIVVCSSDSENYVNCKISQNHFVVVVSTSQISPAAFTHELLHIQLRDVVEPLYECDFSSYGLSKDCFIHLTNTLTHRTSIQKFLSMGYQEDEFLSSGREKYITLDDLKNHTSDANTVITDCLTVLGYCLSFHNLEEENEFLQQNYPQYYHCVKSLIDSWDKYISFDDGWVRFCYNGFYPFLREILAASKNQK